MKPPLIDCEQHHAGLAVADLQAAIDFYEKKLGFRLIFTDGEPPNFAGINLGRVQIFLRQGTPSPEPVAVYFLVDGVDELYEFHRAGGVEISEEIADRPYGLRDYAVRDLYGHYLSFGQNLFNAGPPIRIEREEVTVRLEKRLVALLRDLAEYKRMSLTSCLEEILLHTNEPHRGGVASPHTKRQLAYIQELKKKHGIDYDSHASYRFEE